MATKEFKMLKSLLLFALFISFSSMASVKIEEELYVIGQNPEVIKDLAQSGSVEIDHVTSEGFEVYGPRGLSEHLTKRSLPFFDMKSVNKSALADYPSHAEITKKLKAAEAKNPKIMKLFSIGKSVTGKDLWVMKISDNVNTEEVEPEFKYISSMHGDEITGRELTVKLIEEMAQSYGSNQEITELVDNTEIYIMPSMNPDGSERKQRANANGYDLNRNFPDISNRNGNTVDGRQIENQHVMKFQASRQFSLSANFHGGTIVVNYPWDSTYDRHPLDAFIKELSIGYAELNPEMRSSREFAGGITNGADWYVVKGGMQDWSSFFYNDLQVTVELSHAKWPRYDDIPSFYQSNRDSMIYFMKQIHRGAGFKFNRADVAGTVAIKQTSPVIKDLGSFAFNTSEFFKVMPEGEYTLNITEKNKASKVIQVSVDKDKIFSNGNYTIID